MSDDRDDTWEDGTPYEECYCHDGHDRNNTVCMFCWNLGRRVPTDPPPPGVVFTSGIGSKEDA